MEGYLWSISPDLLYSFQWGHRIALCLIVLSHQSYPIKLLTSGTIKETEVQGDGWGGRWTGQPQSPELLTSLPIISLSGRSGGDSRKVWVPWHVPCPGGLLQVSLSRNNCFYFLRKITETQMCIGNTCNQSGWQKSWESNQLFPLC